METKALEKKLSRLLMTAKHIHLHDSDPLLVEDFEEELTELKLKYGRFLNDILFDLYDECYEDDYCPDIIEFLKTNHVTVFPDELFKGEAFMEMKTQPLRIEILSEDKNYQMVLWKVA